MKAYMGYSIEMGESEGACLIFDFNARQAKKLAYETIRMWWDDVEWIDIKAKLLKGNFLMSLADQDNLFQGIPHVIESPPVCKQCELWGGVLSSDEICQDCIENNWD